MGGCKVGAWAETILDPPTAPAEPRMCMYVSFLSLALFSVRHRNGVEMSLLEQACDSLVVKLHRTGTPLKLQ